MASDLHRYQPGQVIKGVMAQVREGKTTPPEYFTDGELIEVMSDVGRYTQVDKSNLAILKERSGGAKAGIGTARTRDTIIKGLFERKFIEYIETKKKVKVKRVRPTPKGLDAIDLLSRIFPQITSVETTAKWEEGLAMIESGAATPEQFAAKYREFVTRGVRAAKEAPPSRKAFPVADRPNPLPGDGNPCPKCKKGTLKTFVVSKEGSSLKGKRFLSCSDRECKHREGDFVD